MSKQNIMAAGLAGLGFLFAGPALGQDALQDMVRMATDKIEDYENAQNFCTYVNEQFASTLAAAGVETALEGSFLPEEFMCTVTFGDRMDRDYNGQFIHPGSYRELAAHIANAMDYEELVIVRDNVPSLLAP